MKESLKENLLDLCTRIAKSRQIVAACLHGPWVCGYADEKSDVDVLLILRGYPFPLNAYFRSSDGINASILTVDRKAFEMDVENGWLGEFVAEKVVFPYEPLINGKYLETNEAKMKRRIILELLENLVLEFPELSSELLIKTRYFIYDAMTRRARLFPIITYRFLNMLRKDLRRRNMDSMMKGYAEALKHLERDKIITFSNGYIKMTQNHIDSLRRRKPRLPIFFKSIQRAMLLPALSVLSKSITHLIHEQIFFRKWNREVNAEKLFLELIEPKKHLLMPTPMGLVTLSDKPTIEDFARKIIPDGEVFDLIVEEMGGVLNDVYLLKLRKDSEEKRVIVKKFKDWSGFKWFPLMLWALGTKAFAVLGRSRLEREYSINQFLYSKGFPVPKVLYVSPKERMIFEEYIKGEKLVTTIKRIIQLKEKASEEVALVREVGRKIAEAHSLGVALGDCKPENIIVTEAGKAFFVDLEQATRNKNQAWDIAEFLYYSGHYISPISSSRAAKIITQNFIQGYLEAGGKKGIVKKAGSARYVKIFSVFTPPQVIIAVSNLCRKIG